MSAVAPTERNERSASQTALLVAAYRARVTRKAQPLINDPWAEALSGAEGAELARQFDAVMPAPELWIAVRTATLDNEIRQVTRAPLGFTQVVILGAGLDTRAARLHQPGVTYFEVDHPATQRDKRNRLRKLAGYPLSAATFVACDFEHDDFLDALVAAGFRATAPAIFVWEGVTMYLPEPVVRSTVRRVTQGCHPQTLLAFDHFMKKLVYGPERHKDEQTRQFVGKLGERMVFGTNDILPLLYDEGCRYVESQSFDEACLSLTGTYAREREFRFQRIVLASRERPGA